MLAGIDTRKTAFAVMQGFAGFVTGKREHNKILRSGEKKKKKRGRLAIRPNCLKKGRSSSPLHHYVTPSYFSLLLSLLFRSFSSFSFCNSIMSFLSETQFQAMLVFQQKEIGITATDRSRFLSLFFLSVTD